ncbi:baculoviral IAP repeat-containing protein 1 isoform X2 [Ambystoma mexicanum]|uniref:baculoviral IAP repeat-containing protein 1 isoform X2 n=1 Tax=Ambystoma mexicanum TaxID=8296 RepID=UPI0037E7E701
MSEKRTFKVCGSSISDRRSDAEGKHFTTSVIEKLSLQLDDDFESNIFADENVRLESFTTWPEVARADPTRLAAGGFFYTGKLDAVQCFSCGLSLQLFEPEDDAWTQHMKLSPGCKYVCSKDPEKENIETEDRQHDVMLSEEKDAPPPKCTGKEDTISHRSSGVASITHPWLEEANVINEQLTSIYQETKFGKISSFEDFSHIAIDLKSLFGDLVIVSKDSRNQPLKQLTFPEVLPELDSITLIEGEAGSGKTALLHKIAILWASGCCPMLSRFHLVFYLSLRNTGRAQCLSDMICEQLLGPKGALAEANLNEILQQLKSRVLFLFDDYEEMDPVTESIGELIHKNYLNKLCLVFTVRTHRSGQLRKFSETILTISEFPLYSSIYLCKRLFSHNMPLVERFFVALAQCDSFQAFLKTPMFTLALCIFWVQHPNDKLLSDAAISKAYLLYNTRRFTNETEKVNALTSSCGELALRGLLKQSFDFRDEELSDAGVIGDEALRIGLLSKFTTQRLRPVYRFFHPMFQEFMAGTRMSELLDSDLEKDLKQALSYLQHVDTFLKAGGRFHYFLKYACRSSKSTAGIISHIFGLFDSSDAFKCQSDNEDYLIQHPELAHMQTLFLLLSTQAPENLRTYLLKYWLTFAITTAEAGNSVEFCAPLILRFLTGKSLDFYMSSLPSSPILEFMRLYPESCSLLASMTVLIQGSPSTPCNLLCPEDYSHWGIPVVEQEYSAAFQYPPLEIQKPIDPYLQRRQHGIRPFLFVSSNHKIPVLRIKATNITNTEESLLSNLVALMSISDHIHLELSKCAGFIDTIKPAIVQFKDSFVRCCTSQVELSTEEEQLILSMSSIESLEIDHSKICQNAGHLFANLDKFKHLRHLSVDLWSDVNENCSRALGSLKTIHSLATLKISIPHVADGLVECIEASKDLTVFNLKWNSFQHFDSLIRAISSCKNLRELRLLENWMPDDQAASLASVLPAFKRLTVLDFSGMTFANKEASPILATSLAHLVQLEELRFPSGSGILEAGSDIIKQFQHLRNLRVLSFTNVSLNDNTLLELAMSARDGHLQKIQTLQLLTIHEISESGWRSFFEIVDKMPDLAELILSRAYTHQFKCHAATVKLFVQCVSRFPALVNLLMLGWLFDEDDIKMFNAMKETHPQSKRMRFLWQWLLPFPPIIQA